MMAIAWCDICNRSVLRLVFTLQMSVGTPRKISKIAHFIEKFGILVVCGEVESATAQQRNS